MTRDVPRKLDAAPALAVIAAAGLLVSLALPWWAAPVSADARVALSRMSPLT